MNHVIYLPFPPTVNSYYGQNKRTGHKYIKPAGKAYRAEVEQAIIEQMPDVYIDERMLIEVVLHMPDNRTRDLGNYDKALLDAISKRPKDDWPGMWEDDGLIDQAFWYRGEVVKGGQAVLYIHEAGPVLKVGQCPP